ncbi:FAD-dependent oxidoreductase [Ramlibacter sp. WS9]|uniref:FAD-dependent oxidoreductase n=1 Tax=Ramlibacter sp. WS9 TaxID=1882741 RepID=UPI0011436F3B|nr:FAD-dependent oxidoreductase [Ramlibacter sp. WS9]ROZ79778.1 FAD-dependent oxidoreductase [Ramlibacter sp. WS9]
MSLAYDSGGAAIQSHAFAYQRHPDQDAAAPARHPVVVVGAGPVGLSLAIDLAQRGQRVLLLDNDDRLSTGSRAICFAKRTLEIWDRLGVGDAMCAKGVEWNVGKVFFKDDLLYSFNLLPEPGHERPAFVNLQQYYAEAYLALRAAELPNIEIRWRNTVAACERQPEGVLLGIDTPDGRYNLMADYVAACDGSRSPLRALLGEESKGRVFRDRFLIADVRMAADFPAERWFWFDPPFHPNQSVLLHRQPDGVWRIDFQLGWDADPEAEKQPERIKPRVDAMMRAALGHEVPFELEWASVYTFACLRMESFVHGRVFFAGDSAHGVSPFGARGANSGVQDAENLAWKLDLVLRGAAPPALLNTYGAEREYAADENLLNSTRATDFITPKSAISRLFRDAALDLARAHPFARRIVNSGRLSVPATLHGSVLNTPDCDSFAGPMVPGAPASDAPLGDGSWLLRQLPGQHFSAILFGAGTKAAGLVHAGAQGIAPIQVLSLPADGAAAERYDAKPGTVYLLRPDQHVCARWRSPNAQDIAAALKRALAQS